MAQPLPHLHAVILAGGSGVRFWPLSRELAPKQLLRVFGGASLVATAVARIAPFVEPGAVHVLTGERLQPEIRDNLACEPVARGLGAEVLAEPLPRNTAAAVALAAAHVLSLDPDGIVAMLPSDHLLDAGDAWTDLVTEACAAAGDGWLVTVGLTPTRPETGFGYILASDRICGGTCSLMVDRFVEKPDAASVERLVDEGALWNSGMLFGRADLILDELRAAGEAGRTPESERGLEIALAAQDVVALGVDAYTSERARELFRTLPSVPFDKAVLEVSTKVAVVPASLPWSDVGSLLSLGELAPADEDGNVSVGNVTHVDTHDSITYSAGRLVATLGVSDLVVVDTADATLVAHKDRVQDMRLVVDALKAQGAEEVVSHRTAPRPWGSWTSLLRGEGFQIKSIEVNPGARLSLQSHAKRSEHWVVVEGTALVEIDGETHELDANRSIYVPVGSRHRLGNSGSDPLRVIEVAVGSYLGEDDIVRYEDDWGR